MNFEARRERMVQEQLRARGIRDPRVLGAFSTVARHLFVPLAYRLKAYEDHPLPIGAGQTISQPYMVALMMEELRPRPGSTVLEVGTGSGYETALLAQLVGKVYSIERIPELAKGASQVLKTLGFSNIDIRTGDGSMGLASAAPFDGILVAAAAPQLPPVLVDQLGEGGRLVIPIGSALNQVVTVVERCGGEIQSHSAVNCIFVPLIGVGGFPEGAT